MSLKNQITSIQDVAGAEYEKPDPDRVKQYHENLMEHDEAREYLGKRNVTKRSIQYFGLGYDPDRHAISIPVFKNDEVINVKYRLLEPGDYKYTQEKGCEVWLYHERGLQHAKQKDTLFIVEGEFDAISCWQAGVRNVVSPASGKDSYGPWLEDIDEIEEVFIAYDNDEAGREAAENLAERVGVGKCRQILYQDAKDANEYFQEHDAEDFAELKKEAEPFFTYQFKTLGDVIDVFRNGDADGLTVRGLPGVELREDHMMIVSGRTNAGKTTFVLNLASQLVEKDIPTLVLPFERGIKDVGPTFLSLDMNATRGELHQMTDEMWDDYLEKVRDMPLYFSLPGKEEVLDTVKRARRIFDTRVVIIDHLDYLSQQAQDKFQFQADFIHEMKEFAIEHGVAFIIVHHPNKPQQFNRDSQLTNEDLGGSISIPQVAETVFFVDADWDEGHIHTYCTKNKGPMKEAYYKISKDTGTIGERIDNLDDFNDIESDESW